MHTCVLRELAVGLAVCAVCFCLSLFDSNFGHAQDAKPAAPKKDAADENTIGLLIQQLGDDSFGKREAASKKLAEIGEPALKLLENAAQKAGDQEVRARAGQLVRVIGKLFLHELRRFDGHKQDKQGNATRVAVSPDGKFIVTAGSEKLRYWEIESGKEVAAFGDGQGSYYALSIAKDGKHVIAGGNDRLVRVFELPTGKLVKEMAGHSRAITGAALLHDGKQAVSASFDQTIRVWNIETGKEVRTFDASGESIRGVALSTDGKVLAAAQCKVVDGSPGVARLWDIETGKVIRTFQGHERNTTSVAFSPDGNTLLASGYDGVMRIWDIKTGKEINVFGGGPQGISQATFTGDGRRVVTAGQRQVPTVRVWDITSGEMLFESKELGSGVFGVAALADPNCFLSASLDGAVRLWQLRR